jgi:hypothetical protein
VPPRFRECFVHRRRRHARERACALAERCAGGGVETHGSHDVVNGIRKLPTTQMKLGTLDTRRDVLCVEPDRIAIGSQRFVNVPQLAVHAGSDGVKEADVRGQHERSIDDL